MLRKVVPGHFQVANLPEMVVTALIIYVLSGSASLASWFALIFVGSFLVNQSTHLAQEDHSAPPPTRIERMMQDDPSQKFKLRRLAFVAAGLLLEVISVLLIYLHFVS